MMEPRPANDWFGKQVLPTSLYEELVEDLKEACAETDPVERQFYALNAIGGLLDAINVDNSLRPPLDELFSYFVNAYLKRKHGGRVRSLDKMDRLARAAAVVTVLKERR